MRCLLRGDHPGTQLGWWLFRDPVELLQADSLTEVRPRLEQAEALSRAGHWVVGFVSYEAAPAFDESLGVSPGELSLPRVLLGVFASRERLELEDLLLHHKAAGDHGPQRFECEATLKRAQYLPLAQRVRKAIAQGDVYQVNLTFPVTLTGTAGAVRDRGLASFSPEALELFQQLYCRQPVRRALLLESEEVALCSASPELFFDLSGDVVTTRPMKGTAERGRFTLEDLERRQALIDSDKERAENLMIVDMMRNDLGRIARAGSVEVQSLFDVETYPTVHQMTSTVTARTDAGLVQLFEALFPCSSITGAPKSSAMRLISELEGAPREIYTGAVGYLAPQTTGERKTEFSVGIRTAWRAGREGNGSSWCYGVGSGVVWDSQPEDEYRECLIKALLTHDESPEDFELLETLRWDAARCLPRASAPVGLAGFVLLDNHLERLLDSAGFFGFSLRREEVLKVLVACASQLRRESDTASFRVRLLCNRSGVLRYEFKRLENAQTREIGLVLASTPVSSRDVFLFHKTTRRQTYEHALEESLGTLPAGQAKDWDVVLLNERDELTECTRFNLALELNGELVTPARASGLLQGTLLRERLRNGELTEKVLGRAELLRASRIEVFNSVRGVLAAELREGPRR